MYNDILKSLFRDGYQFLDILEYFGFQKYELLSIYENILLDFCLKDKEFYFNVKMDYLENMIFLNLSNEKVILISDTHLGSKDENLDFLKQISSFVEKEKISILFHGGDIGDGLINCSKRYNSYDKQIDHLCKCYLHLYATKQYILGGNHDVEYKKRHRDILKILSKNDMNICPLGYYNSFFKVYDNIIAFKHMRRKYDYQFVHPVFTILGHSHRYRYRKNRIFLPPSCLENPGNYDPFVPGFLVMQALNENYLQFVQYAYSENGPISLEKEKVYIK